jgi:carbonic anhydrase
MKKSRFLILGIGILALAPACATPGSIAKKDPYADPSKFENLASFAYPNPVPASETPGAPVVAAAANALATTPVAPTRVAILGSDMLFSPPLAFYPDLASPVATRSIASVGKVEEVVTPDSAYQRLTLGNDRFVAGTSNGDHRDEKRRRELASEERPFAIVLSCSDSRVPPELIFDQGLGDLFTVRVAGNVLGSAQVASIEYAVQNLGAKVILVMGHESCGAVKAAIESKGKSKLGDGSSTDMNWLITSIRPTLKKRGLASYSSEDPKLRKPVMANVDSVTDNLVIRSKVVADAVAKGDLKVVRGIYSLESGKVDFWGTK